MRQAWVVVAISSLVSCTSQNGPAVCVPAATQVCACPGGGTGVQTCSSDGERWETCQGCKASPDRGVTDIRAGREASSLDRPKADVPEKPDRVIADQKKPDQLKADTSKPDILKPDQLKADTSKPDASKPDTFKPDSYVAPCGNGKLDPGEKCDTAIPAGSAGACPTSCSDGMACTADALIAQGTCQAECTHTTITQCTSGDGCCPVGCNNNNDKDCPAVCGNGLVEMGESCDKAISGGTGACPTSCSDGSACTADALASAGTCQAACSFAAITQCTNGDGCCPNLCTYANDSDCPAPCNSLQFNGASSYVEVPSHSDLNPGKGNFTVEAWVKADPATAGTVVSKRENENYYHIIVSGNPSTTSTLASWYVTSAGWGQWWTPNLALGGQWMHVAAQRENGTIKHYINGQLQSLGNLIHWGSSNPSDYDFTNSGSLFIGRQLMGDYYKGNVVELRITSAAVYAGNFTPVKTMTALPQTVALYHLREGAGATATDLSGKGHHGTISGAVWAADCPGTSCGDGKVDSSEKCDTAIPAGTAGACPTSCNDGVACTTDTLVSAGSCQAQCTFTTITQCVSGDGCCPVGCNNNSDKDCPVVCGNGAVEAGELCDKAITVGTGVCLTSCGDGNACTTDTLSGAGTCQATCTFTPITQCKAGDGCCPNGCNVTTDSDCPGVCRARVYFDSQKLLDAPLTGWTIPTQLWVGPNMTGKSFTAPGTKWDNLVVTDMVGNVLRTDDLSNTTFWQTLEPHNDFVNGEGVCNYPACLWFDGAHGYTLGSGLSVKMDTYWTTISNSVDLHLYPASTATPASWSVRGGVSLGQYVSGDFRTTYAAYSGGAEIDTPFTITPTVGWHQFRLDVDCH